MDVFINFPFLFEESFGFGSDLPAFSSIVLFALTVGNFFPLNMISLHVINCLPIWPPLWNLLNFAAENLDFFIKQTHRQSITSKVSEKEDVGTNPVGSDSFTFGKSIFMLLDFSSKLFSFDATPISGM